MPVRLGVIADDLTGANDTGVQFARRGARTIVPLDWHNLTSLGRHADVLVLSTNSRGLPAGAAAQRAKLAAQALRKGRVPAIYKKIDSTCRGNIGPELDAILEIYPTRLTLLTPCFPPAGRAVIHGTLTVDGTPVHRTSIGRDPIAPVRQSHLPTLLHAQSRRSIHHLPLEILRARWPRAARLIRNWQPTGGGLIVADAVTAADLRRLARLIAEEGLLGVAAGSAGLAAALSLALPWGRRAMRRLSAVRRPILLVVGSPNPTSLDQVADFERRRSAAVIRGEIREILGGPERFRKEVDRVLGKASAEILAGRDTMITLAQGSAGRSAPKRRRSSVCENHMAALSPCASATLSEFLGRSARDLARRKPAAALVLCGGDIAV
ncbi:MAG TPA: four-carbon acid sugar kinase family protein, partial [Candidatus Acidoferrum sp.]|nr:four-carbon acid sugar kinase family protein [Candidatus Acidoferrum sp.]